MTNNELVYIALKSKKNAYVPYSGFKVGACVEMDDGTVYTGANVENSSFGATVCAERCAVFSAVSDGRRRIKRIAIASDSKSAVTPCGICRQVISEFSYENTVVLCASNDGEFEKYSIGELMPKAFKLED